MDCNFCHADNGQAMYDAPVTIAGHTYLASLCMWHLALHGDGAQAMPLAVIV